MIKIIFIYRARNDDLVPFILNLEEAAKHYNIEKHLDLRISISQRGDKRFNIKNIIADGCRLGKENDVKKIAVFVCGPEAMNKQVERTVTSKILYTKGRILFHSEIFNTLLL